MSDKYKNERMWDSFIYDDLNQEGLLESLSDIINRPDQIHEIYSNKNYFINPKKNYFSFWMSFGLFCSDYKLTELAKSIDLNDENSISKYFDTVLFSYVLKYPLKEKKYHPLFVFLNYCCKNISKLRINEYDIKKSFDSFFNNNINENDNKFIFEYVNKISKFLFLLLKNTTYFQKINNSEESWIFKEKIDELLNRCDKKYHMESIDYYKKDGMFDLTKKSFYLKTNFLNHPSIQNWKESQNFNQKIYYGAAGVGKNYILEKDIDECFCNKPEIKRITFHPNYNYSNFIFYKEGKKIIPGHLINILLKAFENPKINYLLVIDGINKANIYDVFGDFIQLIERNRDGRSQYEISVCDNLRIYLDKQKKELKLDNLNSDNLYFPSNLYMWATMTSYDNILYPFELSFKRKWNFEYITINNINSKKIVSNIKFLIGNEEFYWDYFRESLNEILLEINSDMNEERLLGPFFIGTDTSLKNNTEIIKNKVIPYILEDILKFFSVYDKAKIFYFDKSWKYLSTSDVIERFNEHQNEPNKIFSSYLIEKYNEKKANQNGNK